MLNGRIALAYLTFTHGKDFQGARERPATPESGPVSGPLAAGQVFKAEHRYVHYAHIQSAHRPGLQHRAGNEEQQKSDGGQRPRGAVRGFHKHATAREAKGGKRQEQELHK